MGYLLWSLVPMALGCQLWDRAFIDSQLLEGTHYQVKRKDGGDFIALASVADNEKESNKNPHYITCGDMTRGSKQYPVVSWQLSTNFDLREFGWRDNLKSDFESLYLFMTGKMDKNEATLDKYRRLYDRGPIVNNNGKDETNVVVVKVSKVGDNLVNGSSNELISLLPVYPDSMISSVKEKFKLIYDIEKKYYPKHMHKLVEYYANFSINKIMVLDELLERGVLKELTEVQKKGVMTVVFSDALPN